MVQFEYLCVGWKSSARMAPFGLPEAVRMSGMGVMGGQAKSKGSGSCRVPSWDLGAPNASTTIIYTKYDWVSCLSTVVFTVHATCHCTCTVVTINYGELERENDTTTKRWCNCSLHPLFHSDIIQWDTSTHHHSQSASQPAHWGHPWDH